jgi:hypothetical protein
MRKLSKTRTVPDIVEGSKRYVLGEIICDKTGNLCTNAVGKCEDC